MTTFKEKFNRKYDFDDDEDHSIGEIAKLTGYKKSGLQTIYNKGIGAWKNNPSSVRRRSDPTKRGGARSQLMGKERWAMARIYSAVMGGPAEKVDKSHLVKS